MDKDIVVLDSDITVDETMLEFDPPHVPLSIMQGNDVVWLSAKQVEAIFAEWKERYPDAKVR